LLRTAMTTSLEHARQYSGRAQRCRAADTKQDADLAIRVLLA
jgi:hypothetical protein